MLLPTMVLVLFIILIIGFDTKFILEYLLEEHKPFSHPIMRGSNILLLPVPVHGGKGKKHVRFIDSLLHLSGSLDSLLKDFFSTSVDPRLRLSKGHFPHSFNTPENQDYVGPIPALEYFSLDMMKLGNGRDRYY